MTATPHGPTASERTDVALLHAAAGGDRRALGELAGRYESDLLGVALGLLGGREDLAMDALQDAWVRVIRFGGGFEEKSSVKTWLYRIVVNQCRTALASRTERAARNGHASASDLDDMPHNQGRMADAAGLAEDADLRSRLVAAVDSLGAAGRELVLLCYHAGLTHEDAAAVLEIPLGTLKSRLHSALTRLRTQLATAEDRA